VRSLSLKQVPSAKNSPVRSLSLKQVPLKQV